jgi:hypothetical protein
MKKIIFALLVFIAPGAKANYWTQKASCPGLNRDGSFCFAIGTNGYVGCGRDSNYSYVNTFWEYSQLNNAWTQKANFAGNARFMSTGFAVLNNGYVCCGKDSVGFHINENWQYNPTNNVWTQKANFPGSPREQAMGLATQAMAYLTCGVSTNASTIYFNDMWEYNPANDTWLQKASFSGLGRISPSAQIINNKIYIGCGYNFLSGSLYLADVYQYDIAADTWLQKTNYPGSLSCQGVNFTLWGYGYFGAGQSAGGCINEFREYNHILDQWTLKSPVPNMGRNECISFSIGNKGYAGLGETQNNGMLNDFWEYTPDSSHATGISEWSDIMLSPNPTTDNLKIKLKGFTNSKNDITVFINDLKGKKVYSKIIEPNTTILHVPVTNFACGVYILKVDNSEHIIVKKFEKE